MADLLCHFATDRLDQFREWINDPDANNGDTSDALTLADVKEALMRFHHFAERQQSIELRMFAASQMGAFLGMPEPVPDDDSGPPIGGYL